MKKIPLLALFSLLFALWSCGTSSSLEKPAAGKTSVPRLDLSKPADNLEAFVKMRASLDTNEVTIFYWTGRIYSYIPGERAQPLFDMEAMNIARIRKVGDDYQMLTREAGVYRDVRSGEILERWYNPFIKDTVEVVQVWNDPVNQTFALKGRFGDWGVPYTELGDGRVSMFSDIFLLYPSPLPKAEFPENSRSDQYQAAELFQFFMDEEVLLDPATKNIYAEVGWTRFSDFLPWMRMGEQAGHLVYQCRGYKATGGLENVPEDFRNYLMRQHPEYAAPPEEYKTPNMTSWKYFRQLMER